MGQDSSRYLELADWRRRVAAHYAEVRALAADDPAAVLAHWRAAREQLYRAHPQSPVPAAARTDFTARHFAPDPSLRFEAPLIPDAAREDTPAGTDAARREGSDSVTTMAQLLHGS